jgi:hypothetical protein
VLFIQAQDFFYVCIGHLSDRGFCQPDADEAKELTERKKKEEMDREIEKVKKEYEEKQRLKKEKRKAKDKDKETKSNEEEEDKEDEKAKDDKIKELSKSSDAAAAEPTARIYHLSKYVFYLHRLKVRWSTTGSQHGIGLSIRCVSINSATPKLQSGIESACRTPQTFHLFRRTSHRVCASTYLACRSAFIYHAAPFPTLHHRSQLAFQPFKIWLIKVTIVVQDAAVSFSFLLFAGHAVSN